LSFAWSAQSWIDHQLREALRRGRIGQGATSGASRTRECGPRHRVGAVRLRTSADSGKLRTSATRRPSARMRPYRFLPWSRPTQEPCRHGSGCSFRSSEGHPCRIFHFRPWLSGMNQLGVLPVGSLGALAVARVGVVGPTRARSVPDRPPLFTECTGGSLDSMSPRRDRGALGESAFPLRGKNARPAPCDFTRRG
jgi:hypothetical protein